jgi:hypothetical protein
MSATRDKSQKIAFVYSNLYQIYRKGVETAKSGAVLKSDDLFKPSFAAVQVNPYQPAELLGKRVQKPEGLIDVASVRSETMVARSKAIESLKGNLKNLNDLHSRLKFMLLELEDLVKESK